MSKTNIAWTDVVWNPVTGCDAVSPGCDNCYAKVMAGRLMCMAKTAHKYRNNFKVTCHPEELSRSFGKKQKRIFVNSMSDLFHNDVPREFIDKVFEEFTLNQQHIFQILTKRPVRATEIYSLSYWEIYCRNVWLGVTAENQKYADKRIPQLLQIPASIGFVSCEPLLGEIDLYKYCYGDSWLDWVIIGCESGHNRRPCNLDWVYSLVEQCQNASVPVFVKQLDLDRKAVNKIEKFPIDLQIRQYPKTI